MALTFRSSATGGGPNAGALAVSAPAGLADGDILLVSFYWEAAGQTLTPPAGWTQVPGAPVRNVAVSPNFMLDAYWKRASAEPSSWTWTPSVTGVTRGYAVTAWSGASGTGNQVDATAGQSGNGAATEICPSVVTTAPNETVLALIDNVSGDTMGYQSGICTTRRASRFGLEQWEGVQPTAGATGASVYAFGSQDYNALTVVLKTDSGGAPPPPTEDPHETIVGAARSTLVAGDARSLAVSGVTRSLIVTGGGG